MKSMHKPQSHHTASLVETHAGGYRDTYMEPSGLPRHDIVAIHDFAEDLSWGCCSWHWTII